MRDQAPRPPITGEMAPRPPIAGESDPNDLTSCRPNDPRRSAGYDLTRSRRDLGFEPSALEDALPETLAWYLARRPSHPGYSERSRELQLVAAS